MSEHMKLWNAMCTPPAGALKKITGGRLNGKSDINPQWRWQVLTETFGPVGFGWKFRVVERWTDKGEGVEVMAFVRVELFVRVQQMDPPEIRAHNDWSAPIEGIGGAMLVTAETKGPFNDDEAWKKATTDALGNAAKYLGVAADVFLGMVDGSKYQPRAVAGPAPVANGEAAVLSTRIKGEIRAASDLEALMGHYNAILASGLPHGLQDELTKECTARRKELEKGKRGAAA